jgi:hypothetical protein
MTEMLFTPKVLVVPCAESEMKWFRRPPPPWGAYDPARRGREQRWRAFTLADQHGRAAALEDFIACTVPVFFYIEARTPTARCRSAHCATSPPSSATSRSSG